MEQLIFLVTVLMFLGAIGLFLRLLLGNLKDIYFVYALFLTEFLFLDFLKLPFEPIQIIIPIVFFIMFFKRNLGKSQKINIQKQIWPFFIFFGIGLYWFIKNGLLPNSIFGGGMYRTTGNFINYYNMTCNFLLLLFPFFIRITRYQFDKLLKTLMFLIIIQFVLMTIKNVFFPGLYLPFLMSDDETSVVELANSISRSGLISTYSYYIVLFGLFFLRSKYKLIVPLLAIAINLSIGGGRIDLVCSLFAILLFMLFFQRKQKNIASSFAYIIRFIIIISIAFSLSSFFITDEQNNRFSELVDLTNADELDASRGNVRASMWVFAFDGFLESPIIGNGISQENKVSSFKTVAARNVSIGGGHQTYLTILYVFGLLGFIPFLIGLIKLMIKSNRLRKIDRGNRVFNFLFIYFVIQLFILFNVGGGVKDINLMFYLFVGFVFSVLPKNFNYNS